MNKEEEENPWSSLGIPAIGIMAGMRKNLLKGYMPAIQKLTYTQLAGVTLPHTTFTTFASQFNESLLYSPSYKETLVKLNQPREPLFTTIYSTRFLENFNALAFQTLKINLPQDFIKSSLITIEQKLADGQLPEELIKQAEEFSEAQSLASRQSSEIGEKPLQLIHAATSVKILLLLLSMVIVLYVCNPGALTPTAAANWLIGEIFGNKVKQIWSASIEDDA